MRILLTALSFAISSPAFAALNILACEPEWGALAKEIGGDRVTVYTATTALQDPHRIEARPSLIARARSADALSLSGGGQGAMRPTFGVAQQHDGEQGHQTEQAGQQDQSVDPESRGEGGRERSAE